jgi:hypothetical protein
MLLTRLFLGFDATGSVTKGSLEDSAAKALGAWLESRIDALAAGRCFETPPLCRLSSEPTRSFIRMSKETAEATMTLAVPVHRPWTVKKTEERDGHICPVCQVRFSGRLATSSLNPKQRICSVCYQRRRGRLNEWLREAIDTIWVSEVADQNDRVALLTLSFDLQRWLDGSHVDSLRAQSLAEWRRFNPPYSPRFCCEAVSTWICCVIQPLCSSTYG